jgi:hypothetical protein
MIDDEMILEIATKAFSDALEARSKEIAEDVARRIKAALQPESAAGQRTHALRDGSVLIAGSRTQTETLDALLAASSAISEGCGLLILRGTQAGGWNCHGLTSLENFKRAMLDCSRGVASKVITSGAPAEALASELDSAFLARIGLDGATKIALLPVLLKERVAALLFALAPIGDEAAALESLVQTAQLALDLQAYRKAVPKPAAEVPKAVVAPPPEVSQPVVKIEPEPPAVPSQVVPERVPEAAPEEVSAPEPERETPRPVAPEVPVQQPVVAPAPVAVPAYSMMAPVATPVVPHATDEAHEKARRFAKLLVEEIKLYNQGKVSEGRARGDLYSRLREDIEKSRAAYQKRYGESVRDVDYFTQELMRILADNNRSMMGAGFPG